MSRDYRDDDGARGSVPHGEQYFAWIDELTPLVPPGGRVLDLGCGCGVPATKALAERGFEVVGLDFSATQIARARGLVPHARFIEADMATWDAPPATFDAVVSFYALIHVPLPDQRRILARLPVWLRRRGLVLLIVGSDRWRGVGDFHGAPMFWDHADRDSYLRWLADAGLDVRWHRFVPEGDGGHVLVLAHNRDRGDGLPAPR